MKSFFISYSTTDYGWAEWIASQLRMAGYTTMLNRWDFRPGANLALELHKAASAAEGTIVVLSPEYLGALYIQPEWASAFVQVAQQEKHPFLPIRVRECTLKGSLAAVRYVDVVGVTESVARDRLQKAVHERLPQLAASQDNSLAIRGSIDDPEGRFPGELPIVWNVPYHRNPDFTGRTELLAEIRKAVMSRKVTVLVGSAGVGKTQLAVEYAYRYARTYSMVWWIRASDLLGSLKDAYVRLSGSLPMLPDKSTSSQSTTSLVQQQLDQRGNWLLVLDGVDEATQLELPLHLPVPRNGRILVTSRLAKWSDPHAQVLNVGNLTRAEAVEYLLRRMGRSDDAGAAAVATALGDMPLALDTAAAFIEATGISFSDYRNQLVHGRWNLLDSGSTERSITTVGDELRHSFRQVKLEAPGAADLLSLCAFLASDDIPRELVAQYAQNLQSHLIDVTSDAIALDQAIAALRRYTFVEVVGDALSVPPIVQAVVRDEVERRWAGIAVGLVNGVFPFDSDDTRTWPICSRLLPHALATTEHARTLHVALGPTARLLSQAGLYLHRCANYAQAVEVLEKALNVAEMVYGAFHPDVAVIVNNLASVLQDRGEVVSAQSYLERALEIAEMSYGPRHPVVASILNNLGGILVSRGDITGGRPLIERALAIIEEIDGHDHPNAATAINNLGLMAWYQKEWDNARTLFERALRIDEEAHGSNHPSVARDLNNLANAMLGMSRLLQARALSERALAIDEVAYGAMHPEVAKDLNNLGRVVEEIGDLTSARAYYERSLAINETMYGDDSPEVGAIVHNLGTVLLKQGDTMGARTFFERALEIYDNSSPSADSFSDFIRKELESIGEGSR